MTKRSILAGRAYAALLLDMDGTLLSSIVAAERVWAGWARRHGLDVAAFLPTIHGIRTVETVRGLNLPGVDAEAEAAAITAAEIEDTAGIEVIAGAAAFLSALPPNRWAVVTSAPRALAEARMRAAGLPSPPAMTTGEDVERGKPAPDCYLRAAERLGVWPSECLAFEDAAPGIAAAEAAGADVLVVTATHSRPLATRHPSVRDFTRLSARLGAGGLVLSEDAA